MTVTTTRTYDGTAIPAPGTYRIDPAHSAVEFVARHLMIAKVRGRFADFTGTVEIGEDPLDSRAEVTIDAASVDTNEETRDNHLRSPDFLDVQRYPTLEFKSTGVRRAGERFELAGELTVHGVTRPVNLDVEFEGAGASPWGDERIAFSAETELDREDWGLTYNQVLESGGVLVGKKVKVELTVEAVAEPAS
jgi:polyisoprenoid-binding protein YceI